MRHARRTLLLGLLFAAIGAAQVQAAGPTRSPVPIADKAPADKTGISWEVEPAEVVIMLDGKRIGEAGKLKFTSAKPGKHTIKLMNGKDETEADVVVKKGETLKFTFSFTNG
jgi:hypothetical protein